MTSIEHELPEHHDAIRRVTEAAFAGSDFGHNGEAELIDAVRCATDDFVSLVAMQGSDVVGHILFSPATIQCGSRQLHGMGLAPMAVVPALQGTGIGSKLVKAGLRELSVRDTPFTFVAGHAEFYLRFGFRPASDHGITHGFAGLPQDVFFIHSDRFSELGEFDPGKAFYHPAFGSQHDR